MTRDEFEKLRQQAGFKSQVEAADFLGVTGSAFRHWLAGSRKIPKTAIRMLRLATWVREKGGDPWKIIQDPVLLESQRKL